MKNKPYKQAHTAQTKYGMGDYYGSGIRNPMGRSIDVFGITANNSKDTKTPPKKLA